MALVGVFSGAMIPTVNALIGASSPAGKHGSAFGLVGSAQALSFAIAPLLGGITARQLGIHAPFPIIGLMLVAVSGLVWAMVREPAGMRGEPEPPAGAVVEEEAAAGGAGGS
jgi:MFS family permease